MAVTVQTWGPAQYQIDSAGGTITVSSVANTRADYGTVTWSGFDATVRTSAAVADHGLITWTAYDATTIAPIRVTVDHGVLTWTAYDVSVAIQPVWTGTVLVTNIAAEDVEIRNLMPASVRIGNLLAEDVEV